MTNQIGLIAVVAIGLALLIPRTNVEAKSSHNSSHFHSSGGIDLGIGAMAKGSIKRIQLKSTLGREVLLCPMLDEHSVEESSSYLLLLSISNGILMLCSFVEFMILLEEKESTRNFVNDALCII